MGAPLAGIQVLELANWVAGPSCAALMADMGADVVKIEPLGGDGMRGKLRQPAQPDDAAAHDFPWQLDNRGKRSVAVDLGDERGASLVEEMVSGTDIVVTNLLPGRLARYGLGPQDLLGRHPGLIVALVTGFGTEGDDRDRVAFDLTAFFARSGIMSLIGEPDAPPPAFRPGQGDHPTGLALLVGVLAALRVRDATGRGQVVETSLLHSGMWSIGCDMQTALIDHQQPNKRSRADAFSPINTQYRCGDGTWINLSAQDQGRWEPLMRAIGREDLAVEDYATPADRFRHRQDLIATLEETFASQPAAHWGPLIDATGTIWAPVATLDQVVADPQARAAGIFAEVDHPDAGRFETLNAPFKMSASEVAVRGPAPSLGQHTDEVLTERGFAADRIAELRSAGVIGG